MTSSMTGISSYQQINQIYKNNQTSKTEYGKEAKDSSSGISSEIDVKVSQWKPLSSTSSLIPTTKDGYGTVIGDVQLSDKAKEYYDQLKSKYHGMDFILVSKDMKSAVAKNAAAYGNANKPVVLIDDEKLERMATDESFRKKYEGIIAMAQTQLQEAKNSLVSSGANVKNFGLSVSEDGKTSFFATVEKMGEAQSKRIEAKREEKRAEKAKAKKAENKEHQKELIEKNRHKNSIEKKEKMEALKDQKKDDVKINQNDLSDDGVEKLQDTSNVEYVKFESSSVDDLINRVSKYAYANSLNLVQTAQESALGQSIDFKG